MAAQARPRDNEEWPEADRLEGYPHPRTRAHLIDQKHAEAELLKAALSGRLHHAWLLTGPKGIGKATLAYRFARFLLANTASRKTASTGQPETAHDALLRDVSLFIGEDHPAFKQVAALAHPDLTIVRRTYDPKSNRLRQQISIDDVRAAKRSLAKTASAGGWRVCIVDAMDEMPVPAANALLKMLEEPAPRTVFLLICHVPGRLLPTIRSRCRKLALNPLAAPEIAHLLSELCPDAQLTPEQAAQLTMLAEGSGAKALKLAQANGLDVYDAMIEIAEDLPNLDFTRIHQFADKLAQRGNPQGFALFCDLMCEWLARLAHAGATGRGLDDPRERKIAERLAVKNDPAAWAELWAEISHSLNRTNALNLDVKQTILRLFFKLEETARKSG